MKKIIDPFLYNTPKIDVHGYDRYGAEAMIKNFIDNECKVGTKTLRIVHGKGEGILKKQTHEYLKKDKRVIEYKLNIYNEGETIVKIR